MAKFLLLALPMLPLATCSGARPDMISYTVDLDAARSTATFSCNDSSSGTCVFRFDDPAAQPQSITVAKGEIASVTGIGTGSGYCATTGASGAGCKEHILHAGIQAVHHEKHGTA